MNNYMYIKVVGFGRACTLCAMRTRLFWLINKQKGALRAPAPVAAPLQLSHPKKINKNYFLSRIRIRDACVKGFPVNNDSLQARTRAVVFLATGLPVPRL